MRVAWQEAKHYGSTAGEMQALSKKPSSDLHNSGVATASFVQESGHATSPHSRFESIVEFKTLRLGECALFIVDNQL